MDILFYPVDPIQDHEPLALRAFYKDVTYACASCRRENTVESKDLRKDSPQYQAMAVRRIGPDCRTWMVSCLDCGKLTDGVLPSRFSVVNGWITDPITDVHVGDVVLGWGVVTRLVPSEATGGGYIVTTESGYTFHRPDDDEVTVKHMRTAEGCVPPPAKAPRTVGYTELWERMRRALAVEGDQTVSGWIESEEPPHYFADDGEPDTLFGYVLAGLGVEPKQVAELSAHNATEPREIFAAAGFPLTSEAGWLAEGAWFEEMREAWWTECIGRLKDITSDHGRWVAQDALTLAEAEAAEWARELDQDELDALGLDGMRLQAELGRNVTMADVARLTGGEGHRSAPLDVTAITATFPTTPPPDLADAPDFRIGFDAWLEAAEKVDGWSAETVMRSTFDVGTVPVDASSEDDTVCAAVLVDYRWYVIERDGDVVRARLVPID